ncbi:hypothetical protein WJT74_11475 [Sphingomicrobium sp. XHP0239]|uniref:hypothetical protein n=1 Tax=Sphingomicrobium maritimum TaxID=3133972 RepID=UPI0031CC4BF4
MPSPEPELTELRFARLRRTLKRMALLSVIVGLLGVAFVVIGDPDPTIHLVVATFVLGAGSMLVATFLMTLIYFSASAGYDADAHDSNPMHDDPSLDPKDSDPR